MIAAPDRLHARLRGLAMATTSLTLLAMLLAGLLFVRQRRARADADLARAACTCCDDLPERGG